MRSRTRNYRKKRNFKSNKKQKGGIKFFKSVFGKANGGDGCGAA